MRRSGLPQGAWVLVADGEKALILSNHGDEIDMNLEVERTREQDNPPARDWATDKPGRYNDGPSVQRSAVQDTDWHRLEKERFADDLAELLYKAAHRGAFDHLAIAASRVVLAELRAKLHPEVSDRIILDVPKVLTNHPVEEIEKHLARELQDGS
jgi:protein required for attachment to host cells